LPVYSYCKLVLEAAMAYFRVLLLTSLFVVVCSFSDALAAPRPTVLWHGMGDTCCFSFSMGAIKSRIQQVVPGTYVYSVEIGGNMFSDELQGYVSNVDNQVAFVCKQVQSDPNLRNGFNAVGFSQGGQFLRAYVERCNNPPVYNLITMGAQHQGVADIPGCTSANSTICAVVEDLLALGAYNPIVQANIVQAQYFKDPMDIPTYLKANTFLTDINNELQNKNSTYRDNMLRLNNLVLGQFALDTVVVPRESEWFGRYKDGDLNVILTMEETTEYQQDWLGLKTLNSQGKIKKLSVPGDHMQFSLDFFTKEVIRPYLNN